MKKLILITTILMMATIAITQDRVLLPKEKLNMGVLVNHISSESIIPGDIQQDVVPYKSFSLAPTEHNIGTTVYDLQTNKLLQNRIYRYEDGSIGAVWTRGMDEAPAFPDRGTGYNFYDGTEWGPMPVSRLESFRAGWPTYAPLGPDGEIVICHDYSTGEIFLLTREIKGVGDWSENPYSYATGPEMLACPRIITTGTDNNTIHMLANSYNEYMGQDWAILYSRSQDGGLTWDIENVVLEGTGVDYYTGLNRDTYVWAEEKAGTIAIICGKIWTDLFMLKSTDNGDTWEKTVIWEHPYPFFDWDVTITDTFFCMDNSACIALDSEGKAHVVFGINRVLHNEVGNDYWFYPYVDGIGYWNEDMETFSNDIHALAPPDNGYANSEMIEDYNYIGWMQDVNGNGTIDLNDYIMWYRERGASTMPTITIDDQDRIFVIYSSTTETYEYELYNYKHLWGRAFEYGAWGSFLDLTEDIVHVFDECIYPQLASTSDGNIHYFYNADGAPGVAIDEAHDWHENRVVYGALPKLDLLTGIKEKDRFRDEGLALKTNPNPSSGALHLRYQISDTRKAKCEMFSVDGVLVKTLISGMHQEGKYEQTFDVSNLPNGLYLIRLQAGNQSETSKIIIHK